MSTNSEHILLRNISKTDVQNNNSYNEMLSECNECNKLFKNERGLAIHKSRCKKQNNCKYNNNNKQNICNKNYPLIYNGPECLANFDMNCGFCSEKGINNGHRLQNCFNICCNVACINENLHLKIDCEEKPINELFREEYTIVTFLLKKFLPDHIY